MRGHSDPVSPRTPMSQIAGIRSTHAPVPPVICIPPLPFVPLRLACGWLGLQFGERVEQSYRVLLVGQALACTAYTDVEGAVLPEHVVGQQRIGQVRCHW